MTSHPQPGEPANAATPHRHLRLCAALALLLAGGLSSCRILADEFVMLDRAAPGAIRTPDAPRSDLVEKP